MTGAFVGTQYALGLGSFHFLRKGVANLRTAYSTMTGDGDRWNNITYTD